MPLCPARRAPHGLGLEQLARRAQEDGLRARARRAAEPEAERVALRLRAVRLEHELARVRLLRGLAVQRQPVQDRWRGPWSAVGAARRWRGAEAGRTWEVLREERGEEGDFVCVGRHVSLVLRYCLWHLRVCV